MGVARTFQRGRRGGGVHTESYREYSPDCDLNIVGCLLTKRLTKGGGGVTCTPGPPWLRPCYCFRVRVHCYYCLYIIFCTNSVRRSEELESNLGHIGGRLALSPLSHPCFNTISLMYRVLAFRRHSCMCSFAKSKSDWSSTEFD